MAHERLKQIADQIYSAALEAVDPEKVVRRFLRLKEGRLQAGDRAYPLDSFRKIYLAGVGKAAVPMARAVEEVLGDRLEAGLVVVKYGHGGELKRTRVLEGGHPEPDEQGHRAARELVSFLSENLSSQDLLLMVVSGGGSALLPLPVEPVSLADKKKTTEVLLRCGATIQEINTLRKHLSRIKGGRLLQVTQWATVVSMLLSDVVGDDVASIASGPTAPDPTTFEDCREIVRRYGIQENLPRTVVDYLRRGGEERETLKPGDPSFERVHNVVVGSNILGLEAAAEKARELDFEPLILSSSLYGNTADAARIHVAVAQEIVRTGNPVDRPCCVISGGETTVEVRGEGKGGRNQEFALWCARETDGWQEQEVLFVSLGSDGTDGPTDAAGAVASPLTAGRARELGLSLEDYLQRNDSYPFFDRLGDLIRTGPTRTNVMDFRFILVSGR